MAKKRNLTKAKILESARNLAEELGVQQLTFQNLAVDLGIKYPSLYNHFKNIAEVKNALVDLLIQELNDALRRALVGKSGAEAIRIYAETYQQFAFENSAVYELLISVPKTQNQHEERLHKSRELRSLIHGYITLRFLGYFQREEATPEESYRRMIEDFIVSLEVAG